MKTILVAGGAAVSYSGSHMVVLLSRRGYDVIVAEKTICKRDIGRRFAVRVSFM